MVDRNSTHIQTMLSRGWWEGFDMSAFEAAGFVVGEPVPPGVPKSAPRKQARQALVLAGLYEQAIAAIAAIPDAQQRLLAQIEWDDSPAYERQSPLVRQVGAALGLSDEQIDNLFVTASTI
jgi:hypothetical protein